MNSPRSFTFLLIAVTISGAIIFLERLFPFALFSKREPPKILRFIEKYIPPLIIAILIAYTMRDANFIHFPYGSPYIIALITTVALHCIVKNSMVSVFGGTIIFMILSRFLV